MGGTDEVVQVTLLDDGVVQDGLDQWPGEVTGDGADSPGTAAPLDDDAATGGESDEIAFQRLVRELVIDSYRDVVLGSPKAKRPVDPMSFGAGS